MAVRTMTYSRVFVQSYTMLSSIVHYSGQDFFLISGDQFCLDLLSLIRAGGNRVRDFFSYTSAAWETVP